MNTKEKRIWAYAVLFLKVFQPLHYDGICLNTLLFRDFQRFCKKHYRRLPTVKVQSIATHGLHPACEPFFSSSRPELNFENKGYTLVRAELYTAVRSQLKQEKFIYLAHTHQEFSKMRKIEDCQPLIYLPKLKPIENVSERKKVMRQLAIIYRARQTPSLFKSERFRKWMNDKLTKAMLRVSRVHRLFKVRPIKQILYGSTLNHHGSTVSSFAQSRGIPVINLQHGIFGVFGHIPANADWNIVWSKAHADYLIHRGVPEHKIKLANPYFARSLHPFKTQLTWRDDSKLKLLIATQPLRSTRELFRTVETATRNMPKEVSVCYKLHPDQRNVNVYKRWIENKSSTLIRHGTASLQQLLTSADIVITPFSTVGYEALLQNKHVFFFGRKKNLYYMKKRPVCFRTANGLEKLIKELNVPKTKQKLQDYMQLKDNTTAVNSSHAVWQAVHEFRKEAMAASDESTANVNSDHSGADGVEGIAE